MRTATKTNQYQDFIITTTQQLGTFGRMRRRIRNALNREPAYVSSVRRVGREAEVTFRFPPSVQAQIREAVASGRGIRFFTT